MSCRSNPSNPASAPNPAQPVNSSVNGCVCSSLEARASWIDILGLYKPGLDNRAVKPPGTTRNSDRQAGYYSDDDLGRIFTNRDLAGAWAKDQQYIELEVEVTVFPSCCPRPADLKVRWSFEDPDDPTNEGGTMHPDAGRILDPNDYNPAGNKTGAVPGDNDPRGAATAAPRFETADPAFPLSGGATPVDQATGRSKVRFHVSDVAGDNFIVRATPEGATVTTQTPTETGVMTVWDRVDVEYVRMASATDLPVTQMAAHYEVCRVQVDVTERRGLAGPADRAEMGANDLAASTACDTFATAAGGEFSREGQGGWFFMAAANGFVPSVTANILYEGNATAHGNRVRLPAGTTLAATPAVVRVFNAPAVAGMAPPKPNNFDLHIKFSISARAGRDLFLNPHDFHQVDDPNNSFLDADLSHYGFANGQTIPVQVMSEGDEALVVAGISPGGVTVGGRHFFGGRVIVFTTHASDLLSTLNHELGHAFDNAHKCGNWDYRNINPRESCCMNYWFQFVLDNAAPRAAIPWTQNRCSEDFCAQHIASIRDGHLEDNPGLGW
jgi:hypothetical protein